MNINGYCESCEDYQHRDYEILHECSRDLCETQEKLEPNGTCTECPERYYVSNDGKSCIQDTCSVFEYLLVSGKCGDCPSYSRKDQEDKTICISDIDSCEFNEKLNILGYCTQCDSHTYRDPLDNTRCISD